jgi:uncharacterized phage protein gp47/JayE
LGYRSIGISMAGLTPTGFIPLTYEEIKTNIESRLETFNPGFDFSPESPDGQLISIMGVLIAEAWTELGLVYNSYNPNTASGQAIRNIGQISGVTKSIANYSSATVQLTGVEDTVVPAGVLATSDDGDEFRTEFSAVIPSSVNAVAVLAGPVPVPAGTITTVETEIVGWNGVAQAEDGVEGFLAQSDVAFRNYRNRAVMFPSESVADSLLAKLLQLGDIQVDIQNNDGSVDLLDGTPPQHIHVTVTETAATDEEIADVMLRYKSFGTPTFGSTAVVVEDTQGNEHTINFTRATPANIEIDLDVTFLSEDFAGAVPSITAALVNDINALLAGEDVVWSRLFASITPYGTAQVNVLNIGRLGDTLAPANVVLSNTEYAIISADDITITVT